MQHPPASDMTRGVPLLKQSAITLIHLHIPPSYFSTLSGHGFQCVLDTLKEVCHLKNGVLKTPPEHFGPTLVMSNTF